MEKKYPMLGKKTNEPSNETIGTKVIGLRCGIDREDEKSSRERGRERENKPWIKNNRQHACFDDEPILKSIYK